jgi:hypothetical protein
MSRFVLGPLVIRPHVSYDVTYATGIQVNTNKLPPIFTTNGIINQPTNISVYSVIQTITPGISLDIGNHMTLDYTPSILLYSNHKYFKDAVNQSASLIAATDWNDWEFELSQTYSDTTASMTENAQQTKTTDYATALIGDYTINDKMSAEFNLDQDLSYVSGFEDPQTWATMDWLNYSFWTRLSVGVGAGAGYIHLSYDDSAPPGQPGLGDQQYGTMKLKVNWRALDKLSFGVNGGFQVQEYDAAQANGNVATTSVQPVFGVSMQYQPFQYTQISLNAGRSISPSSYSVGSQSEVDTSASVSLNQRLLQKFYLNLTAGYNEDQFTESQGTVNNRTDNSYTFTANLSRTFFKRGNVGLHYTYTDNNSTQQGFTYHSSQVGVQVSYSY